MTTFLFLATAWVLTAGFALVLFATVKSADRRARMTLQEARVPQRPARHMNRSGVWIAGEAPAIHTQEGGWRLSSGLR